MSIDARKTKAEAVRYQSRTVELAVEGKKEQIELYWLLIANTRSYGGVVAHMVHEQALEPLRSLAIFGWETLGYMLLGMAALRSGKQARSSPTTRWLRCRPTRPRFARCSPPNCTTRRSTS